MIHVILREQRAGEMAKALFFAGESFIHPFSLEPDFPGCFRVFSKLNVVTPDDQKKFFVSVGGDEKKFWRRRLDRRAGRCEFRRRRRLAVYLTAPANGPPHRTTARP